MRIGVDARLMGPRYSSITKLLRSLLKCWSKNTEDDFVIYVSDLYNKHEENGSYLDKFEVVQVKARTLLGFYRRLAKSATTDHLDTIFFTFDLAPFQTIPFTLLLHDLTFKKYGNRSLKNAIFSFLAKKSIEKARSVMVPSDNTREDVVSHYHKNNVYTVYHDAAPEFTKLPHEFIETTLPNLVGEIPEGFILHVGRIYPDYKNLTKLLKAFIKGKRNHRIREKLVIVSPDKPQRKDARIIENNKKDLINLHKITDQDLAVLYNACNYFVYPSLYEGFGMPLLEAMRCGGPVATSRSSSIPEVVGNAGLYFNPYDVNDMCKVMDRLSNDETLRKELSCKSLERSKFFSWETFSEKALTIIK